jgi:hypothetical protein
MTLYDFAKNSRAIEIPAAPAPIMQRSVWNVVELSIDLESIIILLEPFGQKYREDSLIQPNEAHDGCSAK